MQIDGEKFDFVKVRGEELYKSFVPVKCPYFSELVYFTAQGLEHLKFKERNRDRILQDQYMRFKLLYLAPQVLKLSRTLQGRIFRKGFERIHSGGRWESKVVEKIIMSLLLLLTMRVLG